MQDTPASNTRSPPTASLDEARLKALADAVWQALDDMGATGHSVCEATKASLRYAFEPYNTYPDISPDYTLSVAENVLREVDLLPPSFIENRQKD